MSETIPISPPLSNDEGGGRKGGKAEAGKRMRLQPNPAQIVKSEKMTTGPQPVGPEGERSERVRQHVSRTIRARMIRKGQMPPNPTYDELMQMGWQRPAPVPTIPSFTMSPSAQLSPNTLHAFHQLYGHDPTQQQQQQQAYQAQTIAYLQQWLKMASTNSTYIDPQAMPIKSSLSNSPTSGSLNAMLRSPPMNMNMNMFSPSPKGIPSISPMPFPPMGQSVSPSLHISPMGLSTSSPPALFPLSPDFSATASLFGGAEGGTLSVPDAHTVLDPRLQTK